MLPTSNDCSLYVSKRGRHLESSGIYAYENACSSIITLLSTEVMRNCFTTSISPDNTIDGLDRLIGPSLGTDNMAERDRRCGS